MKTTDLANIIEEVAPLRLQEEWDNSGWQVGPLEEDVKGVLLCVDVTSEVIDEAIELGCNLIISHHPLIFHTIKKIQNSDPVTYVVIKAIQHNISIYSSHTSMDKAFDGVSGRMCVKLGLKNCKILDDPTATEGLGMIGETDKPYTEIEYLKKIKEIFNCSSVRYSNLTGNMVTKVAVCGGAGASYINNAMELGANIFITADVKYNQYYTPIGKMVVADIGHFESEQFTKEIFFDIISKKMPKFAIYFSKKGKSPLNSL